MAGSPPGRSLLTDRSPTHGTVSAMLHLRIRLAAVVAVLLSLALIPVAVAPAQAAPAQRTSSAHRAVWFDSAEVTDNQDGTFTVAWDAPGVRRVRIYTADTQQVPRRRVVATGAGTGSVTVSVSGSADRQWFRLVPDRGQDIVVADRLIRLQGTTNLRDAGGYATADGHWVAMGQVYRSDALNNLTAADRAELTRLGITTDIDLRTADERTTSPDVLWDGVDYVVADVLGSTAGFTPVSAADAVQMMEDAERQMVSSDLARQAYAKVFDLIAGRKGGVVYHCTAGKDRTGWASATLLLMLGVPRDTVMSDYLLSNTYRAAYNEAVLGSLPAAYAAIYEPLLDVRESYLEAGYDEVATVFGTERAYLRDGISISRADLSRIRARLLH